MAIFAGWFMARESTRDELAMGEAPAYRLWRFLIRYVSPAAIAIVFLNAVGLV
jgi:NSS family neurotransmitter:Na+ symporter